MKKKLLLGALAAVWTAGLTGCKVENDYIFGDISTKRITDYIEACDAVLEEAPHGWKLVYFTDTTQYGAYTFLLDFKEGNRVDMRWDENADATNSSYSFNTSQGPVLNFDSYSLLHRLADPDPSVAGGKAGIGYKGEFEFVIQGVAPTRDTVYLFTKKEKVPVMFTRAAEADWARLDDCYTMARRFEVDYDSPFYRYMTVGGQNALVFYSQKLRMAYFAWEEGDGETVAIKMPWSLTPDGIRLARPITVGGVTFSEMTIGADMQLRLLNASEEGTFFRTGGYTDRCLLRFPGSVEASRRIDGFNLMEYGRGLSQMIDEAEGHGSEDFRFYWNLGGQAAGEVYLQTTGGVAKYAGLYVPNVVDDGVGDQVVFDIADATGRTVVEGAVNNDDNLWFMSYYRYDQINRGTMGRHFLDPDGFTVIDFGGQFLMVRNGNNMAWALYSTKEGLN